jgi:hypothetical protein
VADCLARGGRTQVGGVLRQPWRADRTPDDHTYDLRRATSVAYGRGSVYPLLFGKARAGTNLCVLGGRVIGQQPRGLTYQAVYTRYNGDGLWVQGRGSYLVYGFRAENVEDGISLQGGDGDFAQVSDAYLSYVRDDCIENDHIIGGRVSDSLFDGCFMGISERPGADARPSRAPAGEAFTLDRVLLRIAPAERARVRRGRQRPAVQVVAGRQPAGAAELGVPDRGGADQGAHPAGVAGRDHRRERDPGVARRRRLPGPAAWRGDRGAGPFGLGGGPRPLAGRPRLRRRPVHQCGAAGRQLGARHLRAHQAGRL